jgi:hypothetical protein
METSHRRKTSKLLGVLGIKPSAKSASATRMNKHHNDDDDESDPVTAMQNRMLHKAIYQQEPYARPMPSGSVKPPRGTLSEEKLPYLDWRLSVLKLLQVQEDEQDRLDSSNGSHYYQHFDGTEHEPEFVHAHQEQHTEPHSGHSDTDSSGSHYQDAVMDCSKAKHPVMLLHQGQMDEGKMYARMALQTVVIDNDALNAIPLESGSSGEEEERSRQPNPPPPFPASRLHRASFGLRSTSMDRSLKFVPRPSITKMFTRANSTRPSMPSAALSKPASRPEFNDITVNSLYYDNGHASKSKKKWNLLALPTMSSSELAREADLMP